MCSSKKQYFGEQLTYRLVGAYMVQLQMFIVTRMLQRKTSVIWNLIMMETQ